MPNQQNHAPISVRVLCSALILVAVTAAALITGAEGRTIELACSLNKCISQAASGDANWYLQAGQALADGNWIPQQLAWIYNLWPPGMPAFYAAIIVIWGTHSYMGFVILVTMILAITAMFAIPLMRPIRSRELFFTTLVGVTLPFASFMTEWPLGAGFAYADGLSVACMFSGIYLSLKATQKRYRGRLTIPILASLLIALSAYLRATGETFANIFLFATLLTCIPIILYTEARIRKAPRTTKHLKRRFYPIFVTPLILVAILTQMWLVPWRIYAQLNRGTVSFTSAQVWNIGWMPDSEFSSTGVSFVPWGINGLCRSYPKQCASIYKMEKTKPGAYTGYSHNSESDFRQLAIESIVDNPLPWLQNRFSLLKHGTTASTSTWQMTWLAIAFLGFIATSFLSVLLVLRRLNPVLIIILISLTLSALAPILVSHFESRYLLPLQLAGLISVYAAAVGFPITRRT